MARTKVPQSKPRPSPTPPPTHSPEPTSLDDQESEILAQQEKLIAQLNLIRMAKQADAIPATTPKGPTPPDVTGTSRPLSKAASISRPLSEPEVAPSTTTSSISSIPPTSHHISTAPSKTKSLIPKVKHKITNLAAYLKKTVDMDKEMYNLLLRAVRSACGIVQSNDTWSNLSHKKKSTVIHSITEDSDNELLLPYIRHRFENDWIIEAAIIRHLQERKRGKKRAVKSLAPSKAASSAESLPGDNEIEETSESTPPPNPSSEPQAIDPWLSEPTDPFLSPRDGAGEATHAAKQPLQIADMNIPPSPSPSSQPTKKSSGPKAGSGAKRKAKAATKAKETDELPPPPPRKKTRTKPVVPAVATRTNPKRAAANTK